MVHKHGKRASSNQKNENLTMTRYHFTLILAQIKSLNKVVERMERKESSQIGRLESESNALISEKDLAIK